MDKQHSAQRIYSFRRTISIAIIAILCITVFATIIVLYNNTSSSLDHEFIRQVNGSEEFLNSSATYIHRGLKLWDSTYDQTLKELAEKASSSYIISGRNASAVNLTTLASDVPVHLKNRVILNFINEDGVIEYSHGDTIGMDFSQWDVFFADLSRIREGDSFVPDRVVFGFNNSAPLTKYAYLPTDDHKYIIEPAIKVEDDQLGERINLSYNSLIHRVKKNNIDLKEINLYSSLGDLLYTSEQTNPPQVFPWTKSYTHDVYHDRRPREQWDIQNQTYVRYMYLYIGEDDSPSAKYMDHVAEMVFSTKRIEAQKLSNLLLHTIIAIISLLFVFIIGYIITSRLTRPIQGILEDIDQISGGDLEHQVRYTKHEELNQIGDAINQMVAEIRKYLKNIQISESRYVGLFQSSAQAIITLEGTRITSINKAAGELFGITEADVRGKEITGLFENAGREISAMIQSGTIVTNTAGTDEIITIHREAGEKYLSVRLTRVNTGEGMISQVQIQDITEQRNAIRAAAQQELLRQAYSDLTMVLQLLPDATFMIDAKGTVILWNKAMESLTGIPAADIVGKGEQEYSVAVYGHRQKMLIDYALLDHAPEQEEYADLESSDNLLKTHVWLELKGIRRYVSVIAVRLTSDKGEVIGAIESIRDITTIQKTQDALRLANKKINLLSKISRHDILNQVTVLSGLAFLLSEDIMDPDQKEMVNRMRSTIQVIQTQISFTREYQEIGSKEAVWIRPVDAFLKQHQYFSGIHIEFHAEPSDIEIFADPLYEKVMYNLVDNSIRHGEHVTAITLSIQEHDESVRIIYEDNGAGVPPDDKEYIFNQGFGKNSGFGLFLIREILSITEIEITESGESGEGARFILTVPRGGYRIS